MTSEHNGRDRRLEDQLYVDALLAEAGFVAGSAEDDGLRDALLRLRSFRTTEVPVPCAELVALMEEAGAGGAGPAGTDAPLADVVPLAGRDRKHPRRKRAVFTSLAVAASLGIAGGAAAGNETVRRHAGGTIDTIVRSFAPPAFFPPDKAPATPPPAPPAEAPGPVPDVVSSLAADLPPQVPAPAADAPGHSARAAGKEAAVEKQQALSKAPVPLAPVSLQQPVGAEDTVRNSTDGPQVWGTDKPGTPPPEAVPPESPHGSAGGPGATGKPKPGAQQAAAQDVPPPDNSGGPTR